MKTFNRLSHLTSIIGFILLAGCSSGDDSTSDGNRDLPLAANAAISDMNGDGAPDIVIEDLITTDLRPWSFGINAGGQFEANESLSQTFDPTQIDPLVGVSGGAYENAKIIGVADANHDGKNDVLVQLDGSDGRVYWKVFISDGTSSSKTMSADGALLSGAGGDDLRAVAFTDIDGDGFADILMRNQFAGRIHLFMHMGNGSNFNETLIPIYNFPTQPIGAGPDEITGEVEIVAVKDINNDGAADLVLDITNRNSAGGTEHCYLIRTFQFGAFEPQPLANDCATYNDFDYVGIADITGDGQSELVLKQSEPYYVDASTIPPYIASAHVINGENGTEWSPFVGVNVGFDAISENTWSDSFGFKIDLCENDCDPRFTFTPIALTDLNNDGRVDLLIEIEFHEHLRATFSDPPYTDKRIKAIIANEDGTYEAQTWLTNLKNEDEILGVRDYNGDGLPDLLINAPTINFQRDYDGDGVAAELDPEENAAFNDSTRTKLYVLTNDGIEFASGGWPLWYENENDIRVVGVEEDGLTTLAGDTGALISWVGTTNSPRYTQKEFQQFLADKGLNLVMDDQPLAANDCQIAYPSADNRDLSADFGSLVCNVELIDGVAIRTQSIYGGCDLANRDGYIGGAKCEVGTFSADLKIDLPGVPVDYNLGVKGPAAGACGSVSREFSCLEIGADLASTSAGYSLGDSGVGAGVAIGVGFGAGAGYEDGVLSGSIELKAAIGLEIQFSLDVNAAVDAGEFVVEHGEEAFVYVGNEVYSAGSSVVDGLNDSGDYVVSGIGDGISYTAGAVATVGDAVSDAGAAIVDFFGGIGSLF